MPEGPTSAAYAAATAKQVEATTALARADGLQPVLAVGLLCLLTIVSYVDRSIISLLAEPIRGDLGISDVQIGLLSGFAFIMLYCSAGIPLARIADAGNRKWLIGLGALLWGSMTALSATADEFTLLLIYRLGVGLGEAALVPATISLLADMFPVEKRATPLSLFFGASILGGALSHAIGAGALSWSANLIASGRIGGSFEPWQLTFAIVGIPAVLLGLAFILFVSEPPRIDRDHGREVRFGDTLRHFFANWPLFGRFYLGIGIFQISLFGISLWTLPYLVRAFGFTPSEAGLLITSTAGLAAVLSATAMPYAASKLIARGRIDLVPLLAAAAMALSVPAIGIAFMSSSLPIAIAAACVAFFCIAGSYTLPQVVGQHLAPATMRAQFSAIYFLVGNVIGAGLGGILIPWTASFLSGEAAIGTGLFIVCAAVAPAALYLVLRSRSAFPVQT